MNNATGAKAKVSKEVAEAIEFLRKTYDDDWILSTSANPEIVVQLFKRPEKSAVITLLGISPMKLAAALVVGYEIEQPPEKAVADYYAEAKRMSLSLLSSVSYSGHERMHAVEFIAETYGLKIEGVNA